MKLAKRFYVGSLDAVEKGTITRATIGEAIEVAREKMRDDLRLKRCYIVEVIRVVERVEPQIRVEIVESDPF